MSSVPVTVWLILAGCFVAGAVVTAGILFRRRRQKMEDEARMARRQRRLERLQEAGISTEQFEFMVQQKRSVAAKKNSRRKELP